ncbi:MAG: SDR family oxidoreductase [Proteobacteria bacterium]|nr:SDR family oxidoreductase [Pseudomonadota bacterium]
MGGGPKSGIHRSDDGGETWKKLGGGLPEGPKGQILLPAIADVVKKVDVPGRVMTVVLLPGMLERASGRIVNIASDAGRVGSSGEAVYSAAKGGIIAFTKTMARELARANIQLNTVCPGPTDTPLFAQVAQGEAGAKIAEALKRAIPMRRLGQPEDISGAVAFLASDDANYITGQTLSVSGGLTMHG